MLGATGKIPGALSADDLPAAISKLQSELQRSSSIERATDDAEEEGSDKEEREAPISLATRAAPLIDILQRAARNDAPVMWESV
ncbi:MAG: DUF1840 family protein, partial [Candidatus Obscuribacterales bacterium]|nr:DUF1840 family protein [Steroidobacteraceae bacterium]